MSVDDEVNGPCDCGEGAIHYGPCENEAKSATIAAGFIGYVDAPSQIRLDFDRPLWSWSGIQNNGKVFNVAVNADSEEDAVNSGMERAVESKFEPTDFIRINVGRLSMGGEDNGGTA